MKRKPEMIQGDLVIIDTGDQFTDTLEEVSAVTRYREEKKLERELKSKAAKARLQAIYHNGNSG